MPIPCIKSQTLQLGARPPASASQCKPGQPTTHWHLGTLVRSYRVRSTYSTMSPPDSPGSPAHLHDHLGMQAGMPPVIQVSQLFFCCSESRPNRAWPIFHPSSASYHSFIQLSVGILNPAVPSRLFVARRTCWKSVSFSFSFLFYFTLLFHHLRTNSRSILSSFLIWQASHHINHLTGLVLFSITIQNASLPPSAWERKLRLSPPPFPFMNIVRP